MEAEKALSDLRVVLTEQRPAGDGKRRPYIVAARLMFLVSGDGDEPLEDYLGRLHGHMKGSYW